MYRIYKLSLREPPRQFSDRAADVFKAWSEIFPTMTCNEKQPSGTIAKSLPRLKVRREANNGWRSRAYLFQSQEKRVNARVARHEDCLVENTFPEQVLPGYFGGSKVESCEPRGKDTIGL